MLSKFLGILLELDLAGDEFLILAGPIDFAGLFIADLDESFL